jgi:hypothetical protein
MDWLKKHPRVWRVAFLAPLLIAFVGPWTFDLIWVPSDHKCIAPYIRLDDGYCGVPQSGIWQYRWVTRVFIESGTGLVTGELGFSDWIREFLFCLLHFLLLLPVFSTLCLILRGNVQRCQVFTIVAWALAVGLGFLWGMGNYPNFFWVVWGIWLYTALAVSALIMEILFLAALKETR